jgi:hypothetical protein
MAEKPTEVTDAPKEPAEGEAPAFRGLSRIFLSYAHSPAETTSWVHQNLVLLLADYHLGETKEPSAWELWANSPPVGSHRVTRISYELPDPNKLPPLPEPSFAEIAQRFEEVAEQDEIDAIAACLDRMNDDVQEMTSITANTVAKLSGNR